MDEQGDYVDINISTWVFSTQNEQKFQNENMF